jgi:creatinine amidohydrolase
VARREQPSFAFGATLTVNTNTHIQVLVDLLTPLLQNGFRRIALVNGHGGNVDTMKVALRQLQPRHSTCQLSGLSYWDIATKDLAELTVGPLKTVGHACEIETSMMMAIRPDLVKLDRARDDPPSADYVGTLEAVHIEEDMRQWTGNGVVGYPQQADVLRGRAMLSAIVGRMETVVVALLARSLPSI